MSDFWDEVLYTLNGVREIGYILKNFPSIFQMRGFHNTFQSADLPYGRIYDLDTALRQSGKSPFPGLVCIRTGQLFQFLALHKRKSRRRALFYILGS